MRHPFHRSLCFSAPRPMLLLSQLRRLTGSAWMCCFTPPQCSSLTALQRSREAYTSTWGSSACQTGTTSYCMHFTVSSTALCTLKCTSHVAIQLWLSGGMPYSLYRQILMNLAFETLKQNLSEKDAYIINVRECNSALNTTKGKIESLYKNHCWT